MENTLSILQGERAIIPECRLTDLFASHATSMVTKNSAAVIDCDTGNSLSFSELDKESDIVARRLHMLLTSLRCSDDGTDAQPVVGLYLMPSTERIISLLALFKINAIVLPVDNSIPTSRVRFMLLHSRAQAVISSEIESRADELRSLCGQLGVVYLDYFQSLNKEDGCYFNNADIQPVKMFAPSEPNPFVSIFYTSGSTGEPKGVCHQTRNWLNLITSYWRDFPFRKGDIGCHKSSIAFVESLYEILICLLGGVPMVVVSRETMSNPESLLQMIDRNRISHIGLVPSVVRAIARLCKVSTGLQSLLSGLRVCTCNSELLDYELVRSFSKILPYSCVIANLYGSTENTCDVTKETFCDNSDIDQKTVNGYLSIGIPILNTNIYVLDGKKRVVEPGQVGAIYVSGNGVVNGYVDDGKSDCFIPNPFTRWRQDTKIYNSGDLGFVLNGRLFFVGRSDSIVKVRGQRVSCLEVERNICGADQIDKCVVMPIHDARSLDSTKLVAFCTRKPQVTREKKSGFFAEEKNFFSMSVDSDPGNREDLGHVDDATLTSATEAYCRLNLPSFMVPTIMVMDEFPLKPLSGKIDPDELKRQYLQCQIEPDDMSEGSVGGEDEILRIIASELQMTSDLLQKNMAYRFLDLGGNSLSAISVVLALRSKKYNVSIDGFITSPISDLLRLKQESDTSNASSTTLSESVSSDLEKFMEERFLIKMLNKTRDHEPVKRLMALAFTQKNPLDVMMGTTLRDFMVFLNSIWQPIVEDEVSFVVLDRHNRNNVVAASLNVRMETPLKPEITMKEVIAINEAVEIPVKTRLLRTGGSWMDCVLNAVDVSLPNNLSLPLMIMLEEHVIKLGQYLCLDGIITVNSHPVTLVCINYIFILISWEPSYQIAKLIFVSVCINNLE